MDKVIKILISAYILNTIILIFVIMFRRDCRKINENFNEKKNNNKKENFAALIALEPNISSDFTSGTAFLMTDSDGNLTQKSFTGLNDRLDRIEKNINNLDSNITDIETNKADKSDTDTKLSTKADKSDTDTKLSTKADKSDTYTKTEVDDEIKAEKYRTNKELNKKLPKVSYNMRIISNEGDCRGLVVKSDSDGKEVSLGHAGLSGHQRTQHRYFDWQPGLRRRRATAEWGPVQLVNSKPG